MELERIPDTSGNFIEEQPSNRELFFVFLKAFFSPERADLLSKEICEKAELLGGLSELTREELSLFSGIGEARAGAILAALEIGKRACEVPPASPSVRSSSEAFSLFKPIMFGHKAELFCAALLDNKLRLISVVEVSRGTLTASIVHPREAFWMAVRRSAYGVIFAHNHPSGDPQPSGEDRRVTTRLCKVGSILGIPVLDHIVLGTRDSYYSFADSGGLDGWNREFHGMLFE
ncbi:MAG: DNA repair protein RadC [Actinomycetota bacterium]|nr:DNA repair protein RadC [Actinomycetota bacterium]